MLVARLVVIIDLVRWSSDEKGGREPSVVNGVGFYCNGGGEANDILFRVVSYREVVCTLVWCMMHVYCIITL